MKQSLFLLVISCFVITQNIIGTVEASGRTRTKKQPTKQTAEAIETAEVIGAIKRAGTKSLINLMDVATEPLKNNLGLIIVAGTLMRMARGAFNIGKWVARLLGESTVEELLNDLQNILRATKLGQTERILDELIYTWQVHLAQSLLAKGMPRDLLVDYLPREGLPTSTANNSRTRS